MKGEHSGDERPKPGDEAALPAAPGSQTFRDATRAEIIALAKVGGVYKQAAEELHFAYRMNGGVL